MTEGEIWGVHGRPSGRPAHARQALALEAITRRKHFVQEDAPQEIAGHVARLIEAGA